MKNLVLILPLFLLVVLVNCTKKVAKNTALAYSDAAILDSCAQQNKVYYKNDPGILFSGAAGPHGNFKLRFNKIASTALTDNGKLPVNKSMPEGSLIVKDVYNGGSVDIYAFMYKVSGSWLWGEIKTNGQVLYSVNKDPEVCISCHSQAGNRDLVVSFNYY